jgi:hypothetical protein
MKKSLVQLPFVPAVLFAVCVGLSAQTSHSVYANNELAFRYSPPSGMYDDTKSGRTDIRAQASLSRTGKAQDLLLSLISGTDDTSATWYSVIIEAYPRQALSNLDDADAEAKMSGWVLGLTRPLNPTKQTYISGQTFNVCVFGMQEGAIRKGAVVWTTIRKGSLLSFVFAANSSAQLKALTETMKTLQFF